MLSNSDLILPRGASILASIVLVCWILGGCGQAPDESGARDGGEPFAAFSQAVFNELDPTALSDSHSVQLGLFGNLNVMGGDNVVMGRYRYRVDSMDGSEVGYMTFDARTANAPSGLPVVLTFTRDDAVWTLEEATYVPPRRDGDTASPIEQVLAQRLEGWAQSEVDRIRDSASTR